MSFIKFFHATQTDDNDVERVKSCIHNIKTAVSVKSGVADFIDYDDSSVAFAGSKDRMELFLEIYTQKYDGKKYLYASLDDEVSWQEWDFETQAAFENNIVKHIADRVNRTIKTVTEKVKHKSYRQAVYYLEESSGEWVLLEEEQTENKLFCLIAANKTETEETVKTYKLSWDTTAE